MEYQRSYLDRDAERFFRVERTSLFEQFMRVLAAQTGSLVNLNEISQTLGGSRDTLRRYLDYLRETFVVRELLPFSRNLRHELTKMPKVFFTDLGWRNLPMATMGGGTSDQEYQRDSVWSSNVTVFTGSLM